MSFIAITYGYNQFQIFNTNTSTLSLIDNILTICLDDIIVLLELRQKNLTKEIEQFSIDEELYRKEMKRLEVNKQKEEEKLADSQKAADLAAKNNNNKSASGTKPPTKPMIKNPIETNNSPINSIIEDLKNFDQKLQNLSVNKEKYKNKKENLLEILTKFNSIDRHLLKIDLVDVNGDRVFFNMKGDLYANQYLQDRQCYELHKVFNSMIFIYF